MTEKEEHASVDERAYRIGDVLPGDWMIGGVSPTTKEPFAIKLLPDNLKGPLSLNESLKQAWIMHGRLATIPELMDIFRNKATLGVIAEKAKPNDALLWTDDGTVYDRDNEDQPGPLDLDKAYAPIVKDLPDITLEP